MRTVVINGFRWQVRSEFAALLPPILAAPKEPVKIMPRKTVHWCHVGNDRFYIKRSIHGPELARTLAAALTPPRNRVDWHLAQRLETLKIAVTPHVAYGEARDGRGLHETALVTRGPEGYEPLQEVEERKSPVVQEALGRFLAQMHDKGAALRDLHAKNLLYCRSTNAFCLVDLDTLTVTRRVSHRTRVDHLARLHYRLSLQPEFFAAYGRSVPVDPAEVARLVVRQRKSRCLKQNTDFSRLLKGGLQWQARTSLMPSESANVLDDPDGFLANEAAICKGGPNSIVGVGHGVAVKRFHSRRWLSRTKDVFRRSRATRAFQRAYQIELAGVPSARPLAVAAQRRWGLPVRSYFVMEEIPSATHLRSWRGSKRVAILRVAGLVGRLHHSGFYHRDLKETNIVFDAVGKPHLLDVEGAWFVGRVSQVRAVADLSRLVRGARTSFHLSTADQVRFVREYCRARGESDWRAWWRVLRNDSSDLRTSTFSTAAQAGREPKYVRSAPAPGK